jgi:DNA polymerase-3 subunit epsilon
MAMGWLRSVFGVGPVRDAAGVDVRWVVLDCETTGLDADSDTLLAIGAVAVVAGRIVPADSFTRVLRPEKASARDNILVHRIGEQAQRDGEDPATACTAFLDYAGEAPRVAFHAAFDRAFVERAVRRSLGRRPRARWLDLAALAPAICPEVRARALDEWLAHFGITVAAGRRHEATADAFATAMLFLRLLARVPPADRTPKALLALADAQRWTGAR